MQILTRLRLTSSAFVAEGMTLLLLASGENAVTPMLPRDAAVRARATPGEAPGLWSTVVSIREGRNQAAVVTGSRGSSASARSASPRAVSDDGRRVNGQRSEREARSVVKPRRRTRDFTGARNDAKRHADPGQSTIGGQHEHHRLKP